MANRAGGAQRNENYRSLEPTRLPRSAFDLSYSHRTTARPSFLMPLYHEEVMPGDTISWRPSFFVRQTSSIFPVMDGMRLEYQAFWVPMRLVWDKWAKMHGERVNPDDHNDYTVPQWNAPASGGWAKHSLADYLGIPTEITGLSVSALYPRAAALIWNEWYRDENLQDALVVPTGDGPDNGLLAAYQLQKRGKIKDRFAGALPFAQKGTPVNIPLGANAPVVTNGSPISYREGAAEFDDHTLISQSASGMFVSPDWDSGSRPVYLGVNSGMMADLTNATAATVNQMRQAIALQQMFERDARGGTRYVEQILSHFGVSMPHERYRPELLCVGSVPINPIEVPQTSETTNGTPQGNIASYVKGVGTGGGFTKSVDEWGIIMCMVSIRSEVSYSQGIPAAFLRRTRVDHYVPDLALLGEEAIPSAEIYADGTGDRDELTGDWAPWGYTPRYEAYRHRVNQISGELRSNGADTDFGRLDRWHYGLDFGNRPVLNDEFIEDDPNPIERNTLADQTPPFIIDAHFRVTGARPMPKIAKPGLLRF